LTYLEGQTFFPHAIAPAFMSALDLSFYIGAALSIAAALASLLRGSRYMYRAKEQMAPVPDPGSLKPESIPVPAKARRGTRSVVLSKTLEERDEH